MSGERRVVFVTSYEFVHEVPVGSDTIRCRTLRPETECSCGMFALEWRDTIREGDHA